VKLEILHKPKGEATHFRYCKSDVSQCSFDLKLGSVLLQSSAPQRSPNCVMPYGPRLWQSINPKNYKLLYVRPTLIPGARSPCCLNFLWFRLEFSSVVCLLLLDQSFFISLTPLLYPFPIIIAIPSLYSTVIIYTFRPPFPSSLSSLSS
jgi:hypothetical protein